MSHTTTIDAVVITDVDALRAAIEELKANGLDCSFLEQATPRAYSEGQEGMGKAPFVLKLNKSRYDVGFYHNEQLGGYEARTDFWNNEVAAQIGAKAQKGESAGQAAMGRLFQTYAIHAATRQAIRQGYMVNRVNQQDGSVQLRIQA